MRKRSKAESEEAISRRLAAGKMPLAKDREGQHPDRIEVWKEHVMNFRRDPEPPRPVGQHVELEIEGQRYRITDLEQRYPRVCRWIEQARVKQRNGYEYTRSAHWKPVQARKLVAEVIARVKA